MHIHSSMFGYSSVIWGGSAALGTSQCGGCGNAGGSDADSSLGTQSAGNPMMQALAQALESLGMSLAGGGTVTGTAALQSDPTSSQSSSEATSATGSSSTTAAPAGASSTSAAPSGSEVHEIERDIRHVMHALFADISAEETLAPASPDADSLTTGGTAAAAAAVNGSSANASSAPAAATPAPSFAQGLAALINQIQGGSVPANLQRAFDKLVENLEQIAGVSSPSTTAAAQSAAAAPSTSAATTAAPAAATTAPAAASTAGTPGTAATASAPTAPAGAATTAANTVVGATATYTSLLLQFLTNLQTDLGVVYSSAAAAPAQNATAGLLVNAMA